MSSFGKLARLAAERKNRVAKVFGIASEQLEGCDEGGLTYAAAMKLGRRLVLVAGTIAAGFFVSGCGGVNATGSVSPATFLLPGILYRTPEAKPLDQVREPEFAGQSRGPEAGEAGQP